MKVNCPTCGSPMEPFGKCGMRCRAAGCITEWYPGESAGAARGRELDALVAEKVTGFPDVQQMGGEWFMRQPTFAWQELPHYSTDIAAAWEVVGKLARDGVSFAMEFSDTHCLAVFGNGGYVGDALAGPGADGAETAPHAICLAALRAVDADPE